VIANTKRYDIAIIGAGPAGCAAALGLGKRGYRIVLIEKEKLPREKVCGDAIPGPAINALESTFPFFKNEFNTLKQKQSIKSSRIMLKSGRSINYEWVLPAYNIKREIFDDFLYRLIKKYADVNILSNYEVEQIIPGTESIIKPKNDKGQISARIIIDCSGAGSVFRKPETGNRRPVFAIRNYFKGLSLDANTNFFWVDKKFLPGYFWAFPLPGGEFNVGFGIMTGKGGKAEKNPKEALAHFIASDRMAHIFGDARALSIPKGAIIPVGGGKNVYSDAGLLIAGDAASLADPLQGHGIDKAVVSGMLAARQAIQCFQANDFSADFISGYDHFIKAGLERELRKNSKRMKLLSGAPFLLDLYSYFK
jgi:geranylgeranyl reductase family protein